MKSRSLLKIGAALGTVLTVAPILGGLGTALSLYRARTAVTTAPAEDKARLLAEGIDAAMWLTVLGIAALPVGVVLLTYCVVKLSQPPP